MTPASRPVRRVVVAERESIIRLDMVEILSTAGYLVIANTASAGEAFALTLFLQPDLLVFDRSLATQASRDDPLRRLGRTSYPLAVLETTSHRRPAAGRVSVANARPVLFKPFSGESLLSAAAQALGDITATRSGQDLVVSSKTAEGDRRAVS